MAEPRPFLGVEKSLTGRPWVERLDARGANRAAAMAEQFDWDERIARVLVGRGVEAEMAEGFLSPTIRALLPDPSTFTDMEAAAQRIAQAVTAQERVAIFGDYDVDGASSAALLARYFTRLGVPHEVYIPDRIFEGYGPNGPAIRELHERGATLLITVDCGATSFEALEEAARLGLETVVLDHHQMGSDLPKAVALVNPNRQDDLSGQGHICAAGVVFLALVAVNKVLRETGAFGGEAAPNLLDWLDLVALATVCDVVPLKGVNRAFVTRGLEIMRRRSNAGLTALAEVARQDGPARPWHLGFLLGPRINAGGRIGDAALGARLLACDDPAEARAIAEKLDQLNAERQRMEQAMLEQAIAEADAEIGDGEGPAVLVTENEAWHPGVVGLIASRLKDRFNRPAFAIAFDGQGRGAGSGRSVPGCDLGAAVRAALEEGIIIKGGGHAMAAGITVDRGRLADFRAFLEERLAQNVSAFQAADAVKIDSALSARGATVEFLNLLESAGPYGSGHPQPVFAFPRHTLVFADMVGAGHVRFSLGSADGGRLSGIVFRAADTELGKALLEGRGRMFHAAGTLSLNHYRGAETVQLRLTDLAEPDL